MKRIKSFILAVVCICSFTLILGCNNSDKPMEEKTGTAYGITHKDYVGCATVTKKGEDIIDIKVDEALLPHSWAEINTTEATNNVIEINSKYYAKYVSIDNKVFTASEYSTTQANTDGTTKQKVKYSTNDISNLYTYLKTEDNAKWYYNALKENKAFACDEQGNKLDNLTFKVTKKFKSEGEYWPKTDAQKGWIENMKELVKGVKDSKISVTPEKNSEGYVAFGNIVTGATITDYMEYYQLIKKASEKIK